MQIKTVLHQSAVPKEIWKYKTLRYVGYVAKRKNPIITGDSKE